MREYIQNLDHCPFCKEKFNITLLKKYYRSICANNHNFENNNLSIWSFKKDISKPNHSLYVRVRISDTFKVYHENFITIAFHVLKRKDRTKIFDYKEDDKLIYAPTINLRFDKLINFDLSSEEKFKKKLNTILTFS